MIGNIVSTHGLKGEVKVYPAVDDPDHFFDLKKVLLKIKGEEIDTEIERVKTFKNMLIVKFSCFKDVDEAYKGRNGEIYALRSDLPELEADQYYEADLLGLKVITEEGEELGVLDEILRTGANDVYSIKLKDRKELLLPAIHECVKEIDLENGIMKVHVLNGLMPDEE
ncbi:MAG: ribosome maturation factor RimM [Lachnospiraceae bacterium]|nr:ribosome maturation factor RimM [Lachnospiraceae bacterium]